MNKIQSIQPAKGDQVIVTIQTSSGTIPHVSTMHLVLKYHLEEGMRLKEDDYKTFLKDNEYELLYQKAILFISHQMRTVSEVKKKLRQTTKDESLIDRIVQELKQHNYLGDIQYVKEYVTEKLTYDLVGPIHIKDKLVQKGVHFDVIDGELIRYSEDIESAKVEELLMRELKYPIKKPYLKFLDSFKRKCVTKGFHLHVVGSIVSRFQDDILDQIDEDHLIQVELSRYQEEPSTYEEKQKRMEALRRKGFSYRVIQKYMS